MAYRLAASKHRLSARRRRRSGRSTRLPAGDVFGGLNSGNTAVWNTPFGRTVHRDRQPLRLRLPADDHRHLDQRQQDLRPGRHVPRRDRLRRSAASSRASPGAYLGDTAAAVYSGAPQRHFARALPPRRPSRAVPYPITVAQGTFTVSRRLRARPQLRGQADGRPAGDRPIPSPMPARPTEPPRRSAQRHLSGVLSGDTVDPTVGAFSGSDAGRAGSANAGRRLFRGGDGAFQPQLCHRPFRKLARDAHDRPAGGDLQRRQRNLDLRNDADPRPGDAVRRASRRCGRSRPSAPFSAQSRFALNPLTPVGQYAELVTAISNPNYRIAPAPNFPGVLTSPPRPPIPELRRSRVPARPDADQQPGAERSPTSAESSRCSRISAVDCNEPPSLPDPNRYSDPDAALRAISQAMENYFRALPESDPDHDRRRARRLCRQAASLGAEIAAGAAQRSVDRRGGRSPGPGRPLADRGGRACCDRPSPPFTRRSPSSSRRIRKRAAASFATAT